MGLAWGCARLTNVTSVSSEIRALREPSFVCSKPPGSLPEFNDSHGISTTPTTIRFGNTSHTNRTWQP
jgi:hypothetical protein